MLSIKGIKSLEYYTSLSVDYYEKEKKPTLDLHDQMEPKVGHWRGGHELGFEGQVTRETLKQALEGYDSQGVRLVRGRGEERNMGYDFCFSAPKSVSILYAAGDEKLREKISEIQKQAVEKSLQHLEKHSLYVRVGKGGKEIQQGQTLVAAMYEHRLSRALDPQIHTHVLVANMTKSEDGKWRSIGRHRELFAEKMTAGAIYRAELAAGLRQKLGIQIQQEGQYFRIPQVSRQLEKEMSKRSLKIRERMMEKKVTTAKAAAVTTLETRERKVEVKRDDLEKEWQKVLMKHEFKPELAINQKQPEFKLKPNMERVLSRVKIELGKSDENISERNLRQTIAQESVGVLNARGIEIALESLKQNLLLVDSQRRDHFYRVKPELKERLEPEHKQDLSIKPEAKQPQKQPLLITPRLADVAKELVRQDLKFERKVELLREVAIAVPGVSNSFASPSSEETPFNKQARELLQKHDFKKRSLESLSTTLLKLPVGESAIPTQEDLAIRHKKDAELKPFFDKSVEIARTFDQKHKLEQEQKIEPKLKLEKSIKIST